MAINFKKIWTGLTVVPKTASTSDSKGELEVIDGSGKLQYHNGTSVSPVLTEAHSATITNKVIDADDNTISDLEVDNLKAGVLNTSTSLAGASDLQVPSALAVKTYVDNSSGAVQADVNDLITLTGVPANSTDLGTFTGAIIPDASDIKEALQALETFAETDAANLAAHLADAVDAHDASAISNVPAGTIAATDVQSAINELDGDIQTVQSNLTAHINDASDAHDASAISNVPSGNLAATDVQGALNELQSDIDTRATDAALSAHIADTSTHGTTGDIVGTTDTQTLTNKTITGASIQTPTRLDVKQDTKANLETYALTATNGQLVFATDTKEMFQVVDNALVPVGAAGGDSDVDALIIQTFETAALTDFTQTGLVLDETDPLHGAVSAKLVHQNAINQSFKQIIAVDEKFRGAAMTFSVTAKSSASSGNVTVLFYDETNAVALQATQQINAGSTPQTFQFGLTIPSDCLSFSYTITALPESGSPETFIDDIAIRNYWQGSALEGQTEYTFEVPVVTDWVDFTPTSSFNVNTTHTGKWRRIGSDIEVITQLSFSGAPNATSLVLVLPNSLNYDTARFTANPQHTIVGTVAWQDVGVQNYTGWITPRQNTPSQVDVYYGTGSAQHSYGTSNNTAPFTIGSGDVLVAKYKLPISGWATTESKTVVITDLVPARSMPANASIEVPVVTEWAAYTPTFQGFGTPTNIQMQWRQVGENVEVRGKFTSGTSTAVEARVGLPAGLTSAGTNKIPSIQEVGEATSSELATGDYTVLIEPSVTYITFGYQTGSVGGLTKTNGSNLVTSGNNFSFFASAPCSSFTATETKTWTATQAVVTEEADSLIRLDTHSGFGSTATMIPRFTNLRQSLGDGIIYQDSATNGASFTAVRDGMYSFTFNFGMINSSAVNLFGLSKNSTQLTTAINSISVADRLAIQYSTDSSVAEGLVAGSCSWSGYLVAGDVIRPHTGGSAPTNTAYSSFTASYFGSLKLVQTVADQKITIPTSELRFEGSTSRGAVATSIVKFDAQTKIRGDAFTVTNTANDGTYVTMTKAGNLTVTGSIYIPSQALIYLSRNQTSLTGSPTATEILQGSGVTSGTVAQVMPLSWSGRVAVGDIIRISASANPSSSTSNLLNFSFQEQDIAVAVTNVLPQFSDSDSSIRLDTANGYGSTATKIRRFSNVRDNIGTDIEYTDSATNGASFVVRASGIYSIEYMDVLSAAGWIGISKNASSLTTNLTASVASEVLAANVVTTANGGTIAVWEGYLVAGDVIRAHTDGTTTGANGTLNAKFTMSKVGKPNVTGVDVTPFIEADLLVSQSSLMNSGATFNNATITGALTNVNGAGIYSYNSTTGIYTMLKDADVTISATCGATGAATVVPAIYINGVLTQYAYSVQSTNFRATTSHAQKLRTGDTFYVRNETANSTNSQAISVLAQALSENILTEPETFSTDTASLTYASSAQYTLSTLANAPVGTFITFTYAANTNTRAQTTTAPTQTTADMNTNGILLYTRAYNAASTSAQPSVIAVQIGKGLKGVSVIPYKSTGKVTAGNIDRVVYGSTNESGLNDKAYNEVTGILVLDAGGDMISTITSRSITYSDSTSQTNGYLVINASKNPALTGINVNRVAARGVNTSGQSIPNSTATTIIYDSAKTFDTHGALNAATGEFTAPETGYYQFNASAGLSTASTATISLTALKNNVGFAFGSVISPTISALYVPKVMDVVFLNKNDVLKIQIQQNTGGSLALNTGTGVNYFSVSKIGN